MISFEFYFEKWYNKTPKPLWFRGFSHRYLFQCYNMVAGGGLDLHLTGRFLNISSAARFAVPGECPR